MSSVDAPGKKVCRGPSHGTPIELPLTPDHWYFHKKGERKGQAMYVCIGCVSYKNAVKRGRRPLEDSAGRYVDGKRVQKYARELVNRMGMVEAERYSGIARDTLKRMICCDGTFQRKTVKKLLGSLWKARREGVMRHKKSIRYGTSVRKAEQTVRGHVRTAAGPFKQFGDQHSVPEFKRTVRVNERKAMRPSDQYGPVYPEVEAAMRRQDAEAKKNWRQASPERMNMDRRQGMLNKLRKRYGPEEAEWEIVYYDLRLSRDDRKRLRLMDPAARSDEIERLRAGG